MTRSHLLIGAALGLLVGLASKDLGFPAILSFWGPQAPSVLLCGLVGSLVWTTRARWLVSVVASAMVVLWIAVAFTPLTAALARPLVRHDAQTHADAIYVLASGMQLDDEPTDAALARVTRGLELLGSGVAPKLLLSEIPQPNGSYERYTKDSAGKLGMAHADGIESIGLVSNTHEEAALVAALFKARGWHTLVLVTSPIHSRRAASTFERAGVPEVVSIPSIDTRNDIERLERSDERIDAFGPVVHEWIGLLVYRLRGFR